MNKTKKDDRKLQVLKCVIDAFIKTGEPVGSALVCKMLDWSVSAATIRNDMASLEKLGFLNQPHTSAGRLPTFAGFRIYINRLMKPSSVDDKTKKYIDKKLGEDKNTVSGIVENAMVALAEVTELASFSSSETPSFSVISKVEVIPAGRRLYAILLITSAGEIENKICRLQFDLTNEQIEYFSNLINQETVGLKVEDINPTTFQNLAASLGGYFLSLSPLLHTFYKLSDEISRKKINVKGESNLLECDDFDTRELIEFISKKDRLSDILKSALNGFNVVFGRENDTFTIGNSSMIISPIGEENKYGSFGVIGPIRLDYKKVIPYISYFSNSIASLINNTIEDKNDLSENGYKNK